MPLSRNRALGLLALLVIVWAYSWIVMKQVTAYSDPFDFAALRYLGGAAVLFLILVARRESLAPPPLLLTLAVGLAQTAGFQALAQWALVYGGAGKVSLFCYTMPFWVVLLAWWWRNERPSVHQWLGIGLAAAGLLMVIAPWQGLDNWRPVLLAIGGGVCWAIGTVLSKITFERYDISPLRFTAWQMLLGAIALALMAGLLSQRTIDWTPEFIAGLAYSILLASSLGWLLWSLIVRALPTSVAGLSSLLVPIGAILLGWWLLNDAPSGIDFVGICLIMAGLVVVRPRRSKALPNNNATA